MKGLSNGQQGHGTILDSNYTHVASVKTGSDAPPVDQHEFNVINNGVSALVTAYGPTPYDLSSLNITGGIGWVLNGMFQEIEIATGNVLFQWPALDHVPISESVITPGSTDVSGTGIYPQSAFDYFHINAIDKLPSGDYLVSSRHTSTVFCVSAIDGSISWRLSSQKQSDFNVTGFKFGFQHDVRFVSENSTHTIISIYDNSNNGFATVNAKSSGMVIALDMNAKVATLQQQYTWPFPGGLSSASQGNLQMIGNDSTANKFMSGGSWPAFAEFSDDGTAVFAASLNNGLQGDVMSYRGYTFNWSSTPANTVPAVYAYSMNSNSSTSIYVSWNGATEVSSWRFYGAMTSYDLAVIGTANKTGFETMFTTNAHYVYAVVEALDASGNALRNSSVTTAFTPSAKLVSACNSQQCAIVANAAVTSVVSAVGTPTSTAISTATATGTSTATGAAATSKAAAAGDIGPSMSTFGTIGILALLQYVWT